MMVSVIVTTKNEEKNIANCLRSIRNSINRTSSINSINWDGEIIVVDNNSSDNTVKIAKEFTDKVYDKGPERSAQRNFGVERSSGKYLLYLDADMILSENVIQECVDKYEKEGCVALFIPERIVSLSDKQLSPLCNQSYDLSSHLPKVNHQYHWNHFLNHCNQNFWTRIRDFERSFYDATEIDCVRFVRKDAFKKVGGFDETLTGPEDWDFDRRIRKTGKVGIINTPLYHNEGGFNLKKYLRKKSSYAESMSRYMEKWGQNDPIVKKQLGACYRLLGVFIENGRWKKLIRHPLLTLGMYLLRFMVGITYGIRDEKITPTQ